ncbi:MAG: aminotransferase class I/II-fold pyridoxal phosphate-dependent enzyme, partial [Bdellovibrionales bacterium]
SSIAQHALKAAIEKCEPDIANTIKLLKNRKQAALTGLSQIPNLVTSEPTGAFYLWVDVSHYLGKRFNSTLIESDRQISEILLEKFFVGTVPGAEAGVNGFLRLSFAVEESKLTAACQRMQKFFSELV